MRVECGRREDARSEDATGARTRSSDWKRRRGRSAIRVILPVCAVLLFLLSSANTTVAPRMGHPSTVPPGGAHAANSGRQIMIDPTKNGSFDNFLVTLSGFPSEGQATVDIFNQSVPSFPIASDPFYYMNSLGGASENFIPEVDASAGTYVISANETGAPNVTAVFTYSPNSTNLTASPTSVVAGNQLNIYGVNYTANTELDVYLGSPTFSYDYLTYRETDSGGNLSGLDIDIPLSIPAGTYILFVDGYSIFDYAATTITVTSPPASLTLAPTGGNSGTTVTASATDLDPSTAFNVYWPGDSTPLCSGTTDGSGSFSCTFTAPATSTGPYSVMAVDADEKSASATFTITAIEVRELTYSQRAGYFLSFPSGDVGTYDYKVDDSYGFQLSYWRLDTMGPTETGSTDRQAKYSGSYAFVRLNYTTNLNSFVEKGFEGVHFPDIYIKGYTNLDGEVGLFLTITLQEAVITWESVFVTNGSQPVFEANISFEELGLNYAKQQIGQSSDWTQTGSDEDSAQAASYNLGTISSSLPARTDSTSYNYLMTSSRDDGTLTVDGRTGTRIYTWDWATPDYVNATALWSGGADMWFLSTPRLTWLDVVNYDVLSDGNSHLLWAFDFTTVTVQRVVMFAYDSFVPWFAFYLHYTEIEVVDLQT